MPVAKALWRNCIFGTANPVQPSSSKKPAASPAAILNPRSVTLSPAVKIPGMNTGEINVSATSIVVSRIGVIKMAAPYQRIFTRHRHCRKKRAQRPSLPSTMPVSRMLARLGPAIIARNTNGSSISVCSVVPGIPPGPPMTRSTPPHEIINTRAK